MNKTDGYEVNQKMAKSHYLTLARVSNSKVSGFDPKADDQQEAWTHTYKFYINGHMTNKKHMCLPMSSVSVT